MTRPSPPADDLMRRRWNDLAARDAKFAVATRRRPWSDDEFFASGLAPVHSILRWRADAGLPQTSDRMLEIGCGLGRLTRHFAAAFARVDGIDVSDRMIDAARAHGLPSNVHLRVASGGDLRGFADETFDLIVSLLVFQHLPEEAVIEQCLKEIGRVLRHGGAAALQFDTRPNSWPIRLYKALPDALLPRQHRRFLRRYRRDADRLVRMMSAAGLRIVEDRGRGSADHLFLLHKPPAGTAAAGPTAGGAA